MPQRKTQMSTQLIIVAITVTNMKYRMFPELTEISESCDSVYLQSVYSGISAVYWLWQYTDSQNVYCEILDPRTCSF